MAAVESIKNECRLNANMTNAKGFHRIAGCQGNLLVLADAWVQGLRTGPHQYPSAVPCFPTQRAFQVVVQESLQATAFDVAAGMALDSALLYPNAAQDTLIAALAGAAKHQWTRVMDKGTGSEATLPQWLYVFWHRCHCKKGDVSQPHDTAASVKHFGLSA